MEEHLLCPHLGPERGQKPHQLLNNGNSIYIIINKVQVNDIVNEVTERVEEKGKAATVEIVIFRAEGAKRRG